MPIDRPQPLPIVATCEECEATCELIESDEGDLVGEVGWVIINLIRTRPNPDYHRERDAQAKYVEDGIRAIRMQIEGAKGEWTAQMQHEATEALSRESEPISDPYWGQEMSAALCPSHAEYAQTRLGVAEWEAG
jgi:hypothetical protein